MSETKIRKSTWDCPSFTVLVAKTLPQISLSLNLLEKLETARKCLTSWSLRRLSLNGKIAVLKSLVASQLVYVLTSLQSKESIIREVNSLFYDFLWDGKNDKIKRKVMINAFKDGGLRMLDIESFNKALKCSWIKNIFGRWEQRQMETFPGFGNGMFWGEDVFYLQPEQKRPSKPRSF